MADCAGEERVLEHIDDSCISVQISFFGLYCLYRRKNLKVCT